MSRATSFTVIDLQCLKKADVCFVIDSSGSICGNTRGTPPCTNWSLFLSFVNNVISTFTVGEHQTRVGVVTFSDDAKLEFTMNQYYHTNDIQEAVLSIFLTGGQTNTGKALRIARTQCFNRNNGERPDVPNIVIVITDDIPTILEYVTETETITLKQISTVLAVGITANVDRQFLQTLSSAPQRENENYFLTPDFPGLQNIPDPLVSETCHVLSRNKPISSAKTQRDTLSSTPNRHGSVRTGNDGNNAEKAQVDVQKGTIMISEFLLCPRNFSNKKLHLSDM